MSLKEILKSNIDCFKTLDEIYKIGRSEKYYKEATIERRLRELTQSGFICPVEKNNYIIGYTPVLPLKSLRRANLASDATLDDRLEDILKTMELTWDNGYKITEIKNAIKSNNNYLKEITIKKYG